MNTREILVNLVLLTIIGSLAFVIFESDNKAKDEYDVPSIDAKAPDEETNFNPEVARQKYPKFGEKPLFQALLTPTPTPPPPTPTPTKTPDINQGLSPWKLVSADPGEATIEDKSKKEDNMFTIKVNEARPVQIGNEVKNATLLRVDHAADNPSATFGLEGTTDQKTLKLFDEPAAGQPPQ